MDIRTISHSLAAYGVWGYTTTLSRFFSKPAQSDHRGRTMLLLAWKLPPLISGGIYRPLSFLRYGSEWGWKVVAISGLLPEDAYNQVATESLALLPDSAAIVRVAQQTKLKPSWRLFPRVDGGFLTALATARLAFKNFDEERPSIVLASGPPFHNFVAAYYAARYFNAKLVLDYRDEWSVETRDFVNLGNRDHKWERTCLTKADAVVFTTKSVLDLYLSSFARLNPDKCHVINNGWDEEEFAAAGVESCAPCSSSNEYVLSFVGRSGAFLPPNSFLSTLAQLLERQPNLRKRLRVRFIGRQHEAAYESLVEFRDMYPDVLELTGEVSKPAALRAMQHSSCLLLLSDSRNKRVRAGKVYEYLASGPPILVYGARGEMGALVSRLNAGPVVAEEDLEALDRALTSLMRNEWYVSDRSVIDEWLSRHTRRALAKRLFSLLDSL